MKECKFCGSELEYVMDKGLYRCPNHNGFSSAREVQDYLDMPSDFEFEYYIHKMYPNGWETVCCESTDYNGLFFVDMNGELQEYSTKPDMHTERVRAFLRHCRNNSCKTCKYSAIPLHSKHTAMWAGCIDQFMKEYDAGGNE